MNLLQAKNLTLCHGEKIICRHFNIQVAPGDIWGILGPNGCGKTTLLHALAQLHPVLEGEILLGNTPLKTISMKKIAQSIGILFQDFTAPFSQTVWEYCLASRFPHLAYFESESSNDKQIVKQALQTMELNDCMQRPIVALSGGEKRRLAIAALLVQAPQIYLLDEPTNHLDVRHLIKTVSHFKQLATNHSAAVLMSLHDINLAHQFCNRILLIFSDGTIKQGESHAILTEDNLSQLYQHPIKKIIQDGTSFWWLDNKN